MPVLDSSTTHFELIHGDCVEGMAKLPAASFDLVVTSPPYNLNIDYGTYDDGQDRDRYLDWSRQWLTQVERVLKPDGSFFLNLGSTPSNPSLPFELYPIFSELFVVQNTIHWIKSITIRTTDGKEVSAGHFKPLNSRRFLNDCHEFVFHLTKRGDVAIDRLAVGVRYADKSNIARWNHTGGRDKRCRGNVWFLPYKTIKGRDKQRPHPATFPVELASMCIRLYGVKPGMVMLDPFVGIGHAAAAARECGISRFIGFEIDSRYVAEAKKLLTHASQTNDDSTATQRRSRGFAA